MASEQFSLCWDNFHKNMSSGMNSLLENEDLVDVTLACEGKYLKAHKMVLSVCSPYFKELFKTNPCKHPIVFMKDVSYVALSDLLQFMYQGEVQVSQENLTTFIKTAEALQIKGLTGDGNGSAEDTEPTHQSSHEPTSDIEERSKLYNPVSRSKKLSSHSTGSIAKRQRMSIENTHSHSTSKLDTPGSSNSGGGSGGSGGSILDPLAQFKMEPFEPHSQSQSSSGIGTNLDDDGLGGPDGGPNDDTVNFGDDTMDDANVDDTDADYSIMDGGEVEPQAGTSTDSATGEGQDELKFLISPKGHVIMIMNGHILHMNGKSDQSLFWRCLNYRICKCQFRCVTGRDFFVKFTKREHNHPIDLERVRSRLAHMRVFVPNFKMFHDRHFKDKVISMLSE